VGIAGDAERGPRPWGEAIVSIGRPGPSPGTRYNSLVTELPVRAPRPDSREIAELRLLKTARPELASAVDMQIELVGLQRRVQARVPLPWMRADPKWIVVQQHAGRPVVRFADIPLEWTDFRLALRQTTEILFRHEALDRKDHDQILALGRDGNALPPLVEAWYEASLGAHGSGGDKRLPDTLPASLDQVLVLALRPFLARCAEALVDLTDLSTWGRGHCPCCGWEPEFAVITPSADRRLICGRCASQWAFHPLACPFCTNDDRTRITSFASRDGRYRVYACDVCRRYLKAYDARSAERPLLVEVDTIATLPLDAAAMQRGYRAEGS
jgi:FdhE protein